MPNLKEVKSRISSVVSTQQITKAMKMVAAARLRKAQDSIMQLRPYSEKLLEVMTNVSGLVDESVESEYHQVREVETVLVVVVTSDRGLCGSFNSNSIKAASQFVESQKQQGKEVVLMALGKKGYDHFRKRKYDVIGEHHEVFKQVGFDSVKVPAEAAMKGFREGTWDEVYLIYNEFKNVATQILRKERFLPITGDEDEQESIAEENYIFEPSKKEILEELIPKSLKIRFYRAVLESNAAEQGARMTAMDQATENASELLKDLRIMYNRTRQAAITKEINEIVAGADALG